MAQQSVTMDIDFKDVNDLLHAMAKQASPAKTKKYLKNAGNMMLAMEKEVFKTQGRSIGRPWARLRPSTIANRRKGRGKGGVKPLQDNGFLRQSATGKIKDIDRWSVAVGSGLKYAAVHQYGVTRSQMKKETVHVPQHTRAITTKSKRTKSGRTQVKRSYAAGDTLGFSIKTKRARRWTIGAVTTVKAHTRKMMIPWGPIPARPFVGFSKKWIDRLMDKALKHFITDADKGSRGRGSS